MAAHNEPAADNAGSRGSEAGWGTKHGNEKQRYDLLSPAHAAAGGALCANNKKPA